MKPVEKALRQADAAQQRHTATAFVFGVIKKFGDDNGGALVSNLAYPGFVSVFPLLLILVTVLVNIAAEAAIYAAEINVVLARKLWPRAMVQPPLTEADRAAMTLQALQNQRRPEQQVEVTFSDRPAGANIPARTPVRPQEALPPATGEQDHARGSIRFGVALRVVGGS